MRCERTGTSSYGCFFFNDTATTEIYTLSLHDALPISPGAQDAARPSPGHPRGRRRPRPPWPAAGGGARRARSEEHTSELQSRQYLVCRLLLEKKKHIPPVRITSPSISAPSSRIPPPLR